MDERSFGTLAAYFQYGLEAGIFDQHPAREWALRIVAELEHPPLEVIEVLSSRNLGGLLEALKEVAGDRDVKLAGRWLLHTLHKRVVNDDGIARLVTHQALQVILSTEPDSEARFAFDGLDDCFSLAESGTYGTVQGCRDDLIALLETWSDSSSFPYSTQ